MKSAVLIVRVTPRSSRNDVKVDGGAVRVWVNASPTDGQANKAVCELIAKRLAVPKSAVSLIRGEGSRNKQLAIRGLDLDEALNLLACDCT